VNWPGRRDQYLDNAKLLTLALVVCAHFWEPLAQQPGNRGLRALYLLVYAFHMPVFIMISGHLSRGFTAAPRQLRRLVGGVLAPYLVWTVLLGLFDDRLSGARFSLAPLTPVWITWFLISLFCWRLSAPIWRQLRHPVTVAVVISLAAGAFPLGAQLSLTRTLQFLPFFVIGLTADPVHLERLRSSRALRAAALPMFAVAGIWAYAVAPRTDANWMYRSADHTTLRVSYPQWLLGAALLFGLGLLLALAFLAVVPQRRTWFTDLGSGTMYAFLLHAFLRQALLLTHGYDHLLWHSLFGQLLLTAASVALTLILCTTPVRRAFRLLVEPPLAWCFKRDAGVEVG
jgi:fucose 4-O-acetylase-like acetyltransferase